MRELTLSNNAIEEIRKIGNPEIQNLIKDRMVDLNNYPTKFNDFLDKIDINDE